MSAKSSQTATASTAKRTTRTARGSKAKQVAVAKHGLLFVGNKRQLSALLARTEAAEISGSERGTSKGKVKGETKREPAMQRFEVVVEPARGIRPEIRHSKAFVIRAAKADMLEIIGEAADAREIIDRIAGWAGSQAAALRWYRTQAIPALGDQTAEALVRTGQAALVRRYLDSIAAGGFA